MKKVLFIILAAFAVFSCSKEEVIIESEPQPFKYVFNVAEKPSFDVDTKAVKESWVAGDKIRIVFDDKDMSNGNCFTTLEYKESGEWVVSQGSIAPNAEGGTLDAIYLEKRGGTYNYYGNMVRFEFADEMGQYFYLTANDVPYTVKEDNTVEFSLSLDFEKSEDRTYAQFRVTGLEGNWNFILEDSKHEENSLVIWSPIWSKIDCPGMFIHETITLYRSLAMGVRDDGHYKYLSVKQGAPAITITLQNADTGESYFKTFSKSISGKCAAITFKGPQFDEDGVINNGWTKVGEDQIDGHEWIDMGNGLKWATMNVGASSQEEFGDYFAWGETNTKDNFSWDTYKWGLSTSLTRYVTSESYGTVDDKTSFADYDYVDDAARANWGATWRTPTDAEWTWLRTNCAWTWKTTDDGFATNGYLVTATNGSSIFLPAAGAWDGVSLINASSNGYYWSSSLLEFFPSSALSVLFGSKDIGTKQLARFNGLPVRPVSE